MLSNSITYTKQAFPEEVLEFPNWICWKYQDRDGKPTKVPYNPKTGKTANVTNPNDLTDYQSLSALDLNNYDGFGFVFKDGEGIVGIDLDKVYRPEENLTDPEAEEILQRFKDTYIEWSPSGTGFHILCRGTINHNGKNTGKGKWLEQYDRKRFFTVTFKPYSPTPKGIIDQQANLDWLGEKYFKEERLAEVIQLNRSGQSARPDQSLDAFVQSKMLSGHDKELLKLALTHHSTGQRFKALYVG